MRRLWRELELEACIESGLILGILVLGVLALSILVLGVLVLGVIVEQI